MALHSTAIRNLTKVWKTKTGPLQGDREWPRCSKSSEIKNPTIKGSQSPIKNEIYLTLKNESLLS